MAHHTTTHRRILASPDPPNPSSMDPTLKRHPKPTSSHLTNNNPDSVMPSKPIYMSSKPNSNHKVTSSLTTQKPTKNPPFASIDTRLQAKSMTLSADFDSCRVSFIKPNHHHQKLKSFEPKVVKDKKTNEASCREQVKKPSSQESVDKREVEQVQVSEKKNKKKKEAYAKVEETSDLKDLVKRPHDVKLMTVSLGGGRRRSFCGAQVELADFLANNGAKIVSVDMPPFMQIHAVDCARKTSDSLEKFTAKTLALTLKKEFDGVYGPAWHCIVGTSFGSFVTHSVGGFLYFSLDQKVYVLLFKTTVQRAE